MDERDKHNILSNMTTLVKFTSSFDDVFGALRKKSGMFNNYMVNEILSVEESKRVEFLYRYVTTRGPSAFGYLCDAFNETGNNRLAAVLIDGERSRVFANGYGSNQLTLNEEYPYHEEEWQVKKDNVTRYDWDSEKVYRMGSNPKGLALIINIKFYVNGIRQEREGSEQDVKRLKSVLTQLDYVVIVHEDLKGQEILEKVKLFAKSDEHHNCDSCIVFVMGHGRNDSYVQKTNTVNIEGFDGQAVNSEDIIRYLMPDQCPALIGKPKLVFFQCCRGNNYPYHVTTEVDPLIESNDSIPDQDLVQVDGKMITPPTTIEGIRIISDLLIGFSTSPGFLSLRDGDTGSWYIQTLCQVLCKHAQDSHIAAILAKVKQMQIRENVTVDIVHEHRGFNRNFFFQPGIFDV